MIKNKKPSFAYSVFSLLLIVTIIVIGMLVFDASLQIMLFIGFMTAIPLAMTIGFSFSEIETIAYDMIRKALGPALILLAVGALIGAWMYSGTVPTIIYAGLALITPEFFLVTTVILCIFVSMATGTSWGTVGTAGVAMIGIGTSLGIPPGMTAGAIISGAWFGDKMSPLSDSTNMLPALVGTNVYTHIKHMLKTTGPALILSLIAFQILNMRFSSSNVNQTQIDGINSALSEIFNISWVAAIPAIVVLTLLLMRKPPVTSIFTGAIIGVIVGISYQGMTIESGFTALYNGFSIDTGNELLDGLLNRGGVVSMLDIIALFIFAMGLGGVLSGSGMLGSILESFASGIKTSRSILLITVVVTWITNMVGATITFAHVMTATIMRPLYEKKRIKPENLSRVIEDSGTLASPIIPWNTSAIFAVSALGVGVGEYMPYAFLTYFTLAITIIYSITGFTITTYDDDDNVTADKDGDISELKTKAANE